MSVTSQPLASAPASQDKNNGHDGHTSLQLPVPFLWEVRTENGQFTSSDAPIMSSQNVPWIAHGAQSAAFVIVEDKTQLHLLNMNEAKELRKVDPTSFHTRVQVQAMALSDCGAFLAIADASKTFLLYNSNGTLLIRHQVDLEDLDVFVSIKFMSLYSSSDTFQVVVVTQQGVLLQLGAFRVAELENLDFQDAVMETTCCKRTSVGRLTEQAQSCMLVRSEQLEKCIILGNHGAFVSVWEAKDMEKDVEKVAATELRSAFVDAMDFDNNYGTLVILCEGKISWWTWRDLIELFEVNLSGVVSFAILGSGENGNDSVAQLAVATLSEDGNAMPLFKLIEVPSPESSDSKTGVVSKTKTFECLETRAACVDVALFAITRTGNTNHRQALAACRTDRGISMFTLTEESEVSPSIIDDRFVVGSDKDAVSIADSLMNTPISSLLQEEAWAQFQAKVHVCTRNIGESNDESCTILTRLLAVAAKIRELTSSSPRSLSSMTSLLQWCDDICELSYKWTTFQLLCNSLAEAREMTLRNKWQQFQTMTVVDSLLRFLKAGSMRAARILWDRHVDDDMIRSVGMLLDALPMSLPLSAYAPWIQHGVLPRLLTLVRQAQTGDRDLLAKVAVWLFNRAEAAAAQCDVDTAIGICDLLKSADEEEDAVNVVVYLMNGYNMRLSAGSNDLTHDAEALPTLDPFERLERLCEKLRDVQRLAVEHQFLISFSLFKDETPATIAMSMLDRGVDAVSLKKEVDEHVQKYLQSHDVEVDPVLYDYVTELAESMTTCDAVDESRAMVLLDEISDINLRVDATLVLLRSVVPPYSIALKEYVTKCTQWKSERVKEIRDRVRLMEIQDMLTKYNIKHYDPADAKSASRYVSHILSQIAMPTAFKDAMLLIDANPGLRCDRAAVRFTENLFFHFDARTNDLGTIVSKRRLKAMEALSEVKKRSDPTSNLILYASLMEEIVEFGVLLLKSEAEEYEANRKHKPQSFVLCMLQSLVTVFVSELKSLLTFASDDSLRVYVESPEFLLSDALRRDLQRICQIEAEFGLLLSISTIRDVELCEQVLKDMIQPDVLFAEENDDGERIEESFVGTTRFPNGNGKKRASATSYLTQMAAKKRQRTCEREGRQTLHSTNLGLQQDDKKTRLIFDLNRFASVVGIDAKTCRALIAQSAVSNGSILYAVRFSRDLYPKRSCNSNCRSDNLDGPDQIAFSGRINLADTLRKVARSLLLYSSRHVNETYNESPSHHQAHSFAQLARVQAPMYALELLRYALCTCDRESLDEMLLLLRSTILVNDALQYTEHYCQNIKTEEGRWTLYPRWYRGDACALASFETMKLVTKFAIAEVESFGYEDQEKDLSASKRYISFLVEERADLLSLQALMSMQALPEETAIVANTQMVKLLTSVFRSQEIDNHLALGLMLSMKQEDAFHAFRKQISRENVAKDFQRFQHLAFIGADAARAWQQMAFLNQCVELEGNARWWHYLTLLGIECDHKAFHSDRRDLAYIRRLVPQLITLSNHDFQTVLEFTRHYQIDDSFPALVYAEALLVDKSASEKLEYQEKIISVISEIHEEHSVKMLLKSICKIPGHDFDRLLFVFRLLLEYTTYREREEVKRRVEILRLLKAFAAIQSRKEQGLHVHMTRDSKQLSFHELMAKPREVLSRLMTEESFDALIGLAKPLRLERDELRMLLLRSMITRNLKCKTRDGRTKLTAFSSFKNILLGLSDTESRVTAAEWLADNFPLGEEKLKALAFALEAAGSCQDECEDVTSTSFTGEEALTRLQAKILKVKVEMLLRKIEKQTTRVAELMIDTKHTKKLLALVSEPEQLFRELYRRYALVFYNQDSNVLDAVASSIGDLLHLPQVAIRLDLVREWLVQDAVHFDKVVTSQEDPFELLKAEKLHQLDEDYAKRILYLASGKVKAGNLFGEQVFSYLVEFAKDSRPRAGVTFRAKARALRVVLRLSQLDHAAVVRLVATTYGTETIDSFFRDLLEFRKHCTQMVTFEEHRVPYDMAYLLKSDKEVLVRSFLRRFPRDEPWVLQCASQLMLNFQLAAPTLWEDILSNMLQLGMVRSLIAILKPLSSKSFVRSLNCGRQVWEKSLTSPIVFLKDKLQFQSTTGQETSKEAKVSAYKPREDTGVLQFAGLSIPTIRSVFEKIVFLLQTCPFLDQIDVPAIVLHVQDLVAMVEDEPNGAELVQQLDLHGFAVQCAMVIVKAVARFDTLVAIIHAGGYSSVLQELTNSSCLFDDKLSEIASDDDIGEHIDAHRLIQISFAEAAKRKAYACILNTRFEPRFVEYLAASANIDHLVSLLLADKRTEAALKAVELYYKYHPSAAPSINEMYSDDDGEAEASSDSRWKMLDAFLASRSNYFEQFLKS